MAIALVFGWTQADLQGVAFDYQVWDHIQVACLSPLLCD